MNSLTILIPTFNEEKNLTECLESAKWADEIFVIDSFSTDKTIEIAKKYTSRIVQREYKSHADQRNWGIAQSSHPWVFILDADERITPELKDEIVHVLNKPTDKDSYLLSRRNYFLGKEIRHAGWGQDWIVRLFRRDNHRFEEWGYHGCVKPTANTGKLKGKLIHYTYPTLEDFFIKSDRYSTGGARMMLQKNKKVTLFHLAFRPLWRFIFMYVFRLGFLDGYHGFILSGLYGYYVFTKYTKLWYYINIDQSR